MANKAGKPIVYATVKFYQKTYLRGTDPRMPLDVFPFWVDRATEQINHFTLNRIDKAALYKYGVQIGKCACELAEFLYVNEGSENKASESVQGRSVVYEQGTPYRTCQRHLGMTGMMYRGAGRAS